MTCRLWTWALGPGDSRLQLTASDPAIGNGSWAVDVVRQGTFWLNSTTGTSSTLASLKPYSTDLGGVNVRISRGLTLAGEVGVRNGGAVSVLGGTLRSAAVDVTGTGVIDLRGNSLIVDYDAISPAGSIRAQLASHRITRLLADATRGVGYADNAALGLATFAGQPVVPSSVLVKFTYLGDANLDSQVDISALASLAPAWQSSGEWINGDFDYNGSVDITDLAALATNWQAGVGSPLAMPFDEALAMFGLPVPEPALGAAFVVVAISRRLNRQRA